jgi:hypothetical protein
VVTEDPTAVIDAQISARIAADGVPFAELGPYNVHVTGTPARVPMPLDDTAVRALHRIEQDNPKAMGSVLYSVAITTQTPGGPRTDSYMMSSPVSLHDPVAAGAPTAVPVPADHVFAGSSQHARGTLTLPAVAGWPRTSLTGSPVPSFGPIVVGPGCNAYLVGDVVLAAVRRPSGFLATVGGPGDTVRAGNGFRVRASEASERYLHATAAGLRRVGRHRYAGLRLDATFDPECDAAAPRTPAFLDGLAQAVRGLRAKVRLLHRL